MTRDLLYELVHLYNVELTHGENIDAEQLVAERRRVLELIEAAEDTAA